MLMKKCTAPQHNHGMNTACNISIIFSLQNRGHLFINQKMHGQTTYFQVKKHIYIKIMPLIKP